MKFLILLFATVALASATFIGGKYIDIKEDGTIFIKSEDGKQIYITKHYGPSGQKNVKIEVTGPNNFAKMYQFEYNNQLNTFNKDYQNQYDIIDVIVREYLGHVDEVTYQQLLNKVQKAVLNGYLDGQVLFLLQALCEDTKWDSMISGQNIHNGQISGLLNEMTQQNKYGLGFFGKLFKGQGIYSQGYNRYSVDQYMNVLMKIFDRQVLKTILMQQQIYNQEMYGQYSYENMWDMVFSNQGIFDSQYLVQIINNIVLRNYFVQQGIFDSSVLDQILVAYKTEGVYEQYMLQSLVNTQVLKYFFVNHGVSVYDILGQTFYNTTYNKDVYVSNILERIISQPIWRNVMVQCGIFNRNILNQILYHYNTQGVYDQVLLMQLVNKEALYSVLAQYGIVDESILGQYVDNEYLGLNFLYKNNFFQQTPRVTYQQLFETYGNVPKYFNKMQMYGGNFWKKMLTGQENYGFNQGPYSHGKYYHQYPLTQWVY